MSFLTNSLFWKIVGVAFLAGGFVVQFQYMSGQMEELIAQKAINAKVHVYIMQRLASTPEYPGPLRPLSQSELELIGLLKKEASQ